MGRYKYFLLVGLMLSFFGCKSSQVFYNKNGQLKNIPDYKLINSTETKYIDCHSIFYKKFKAEFDFKGESKSFKGNLYVLKDSSIVVSINPLMGIELLRVKLQPGKVEIIDRTKKVYSHGDYRILWDKFLIEIDFYTLQSILLNELFAYPIGDNDKHLKRYKHYCSDNVYQLQSLKEGKFTRKYKKDKTTNIIYHQFSILPEIFKISKVYIKDFEVNSEITIEYGKFIEVQSGLVPSTILFNGQRGSDNFSLTIQFDHIDIDSQNSIGFKVSDKYKKVDLSNEH
ncbi:DUF4292 domain-containing protein [Carboxylicivirga marina]|uniref:DUF4292 domain-containing protein n=1 Tax=Carboxylicivirga marina TaxID=2800988 RepID=UPI00259A2790|nr:DUF4292 domain-containing protein [uncultured Carboxylicivirga sp.]